MTNDAPIKAALSQLQAAFEMLGHLDTQKGKRKLAVNHLRAVRTHLERAALAADPLGFNEAKLQAGEAQAERGEHEPLEDAVEELSATVDAKGRCPNCANQYPLQRFADWAATVNAPQPDNQNWEPDSGVILHAIDEHDQSMSLTLEDHIANALLDDMEGVTDWDGSRRPEKCQHVFRPWRVGNNLVRCHRCTTVLVVPEGDAPVADAQPDNVSQRAAVCTGVAASWCPVHGDCTCPRDEEGMLPREHLCDLNCPLHGQDSEHPIARPEQAGE